MKRILYTVPLLLVACAQPTLKADATQQEKICHHYQKQYQRNARLPFEGLSCSGKVDAEQQRVCFNQLETKREARDSAMENLIKYNCPIQD